MNRVARILQRKIRRVKERRRIEALRGHWILAECCDIKIDKLIVKLDYELRDEAEVVTFT